MAEVEFGLSRLGPLSAVRHFFINISFGDPSYVDWIKLGKTVIINLIQYLIICELFVRIKN